MNEYMYPTDNKMLLYQHNNNQFPTSPSSNNTTSPQQQNPLLFQQFNTASSDMTLLSDNWSGMNVMTTNPVSCNLQDVLLYYRSQPELLRLILMSKVEEDKRRTEEARLRAKELDVLLLQEQQQLMTMASAAGIGSAGFDGTTTNASGHLPDQQQYREASPPCHPYDITPQEQQQQQPSLDDYAQRSFSSPSNSSSTASTPSTSLMSVAAAGYPPTPGKCEPVNTLSPTDSFPQPSSPPSSTSVTTQQQPPPSQQHQRPIRRRREMQAITKIVETREYPYVDGFFWKNNGNTVQKKTGNKSIYYKCSNSGKGCPVNKTVSWKENGEFLIKYRGEHLPDCGKVQRIVDV
ncbi:hypothetical protein O0I10_000606 [Lichtheimia ornata]|uniref:WRKY domain-containing protein n=1 Tax=Lichtheimia ornata TaxID=688661 RepID=A0AAD7Y400_9FUNG|nr:uncharacterized protein O0I10_000606 [Lichtheimia ornata]KAJ8663367.1 hypothetical protein O0I10_000606 [Lichtheimia ornata]